jgi:CheY-like chemotaxis protein
MVQVNSKEDFIRALSEHQFDLVLSDFSVPGYNGLEALALTQTTQPEAPFILVSGTLGEDQAVESLKSGATDYVLKGRLARLVPAVRRALAESRKRMELRLAEEAIHQSEYKYRHLFENLGDAAFLVEAENRRVVDTNPQAERLLERPRAQIVGRSLESILSPAALEEFRRSFQAACSSELQAISTPKSWREAAVLSRLPLAQLPSCFMAEDPSSRFIATSRNACGRRSGFANRPVFWIWPRTSSSFATSRAGCSMATKHANGCSAKESTPW